jgi:hypothetical protein
MHADGSSVTGVSAPLRRSTVRPGMTDQMGWTIVGGGRTAVCHSRWNVSPPIALLLRRRLSPERHACAAERRTSSSTRKFPRIPSSWQGPRSFRQSIRAWSLRGACRCARHHRHSAFFVRRSRFLVVRRVITPSPRRDVVPSWGNPRKSHGPVPGSVPGWVADVLHAIHVVFDGWMVQP